MRLRHAVLLPALIAVAGCSGGAGDSDRQVHRGTVTIGFPNDLGRDRELSNGARIAVREINGLGGIDGSLKIRLLVRDTGGYVGGAERVARRLVAEGARVLVLPCDLASQGAIVHALRGSNVLLLATCNYDPGLVARTPRLWAVGVGANIEAAALADYAQSHGYRRVYVTPSETADGGAISHYFSAAATRRGIDAGEQQPQHADAVLSLGSVQSTVLLTRNFSRPVLASDLADSHGILRANGVTFTTFGYPDPGLATDEFYERYRSSYGARPGSSRSVLAYTAVKLFERAVNRANSADLQAVTGELRGLEWDSPLGRVSYEHGRSPEAKVAIVQVKDGRLELVTHALPEDVPVP